MPDNPNDNSSNITMIIQDPQGHVIGFAITNAPVEVIIAGIEQVNSESSSSS